MFGRVKESFEGRRDTKIPQSKYLLWHRKNENKTEIAGRLCRAPNCR